MESTATHPIYPEKTFGYSRESALFNIKPTDLSVISRQNVDFGPMAAIRAHAPIEFNILGNSSNYIDMKNIRLHIKVKITDATGNNITSSDDVTLANMPISSLFSSCELYLQQRRVDSCSLYPYRAMIDTLLTSDSDELKGELTLGLFDKEVFGSLGVTVANPDSGTINNFVILENYEKPVK